MIFATPTSVILSSNQEYEMAQQQDANNNATTTTLMTDKDDLNNNYNSFVFPYRFEDTPRRIRGCTEIVSPTGHHVPRNGKYKIVVTAIIFGKQVRSEGILHLEFFSSNTKDGLKNFGWNIQGSTVFGVTKTTIQDGFISAEGHFYWILPLNSALSKERDKNDKKIQQQYDAVLYRGIIDMDDMDTFSFEDGEFQSLKDGAIIIESSPSTSGTIRRPEGRIVRFEYLGDEDQDHDDQVATPNTRSNNTTVLHLV
jgi:hypothetical protein